MPMNGLWDPMANRKVDKQGNENSFLYQCMEENL